MRFPPLHFVSGCLEPTFLLPNATVNSWFGRPRGGGFLSPLPFLRPATICVVRVQCSSRKNRLPAVANRRCFLTIRFSVLELIDLIDLAAGDVRRRPHLSNSPVGLPALKRPSAGVIR